MKFNNKINYYTLPYLRVGVLSDSQLSPHTNNGLFIDNLVNSLKVVRDNNCNVVLFGGDVGNRAKAVAYDNYNSAYSLVFGSDKPIVQTIMGNHDYYRWGSACSCRRLFAKCLGEEPFSHNVINGYHFIACSVTHALMFNSYRVAGKWLTNHLDIASRDSDGRAIFVLTHNAQQGTVYGSDEWGDKLLGKILNKYENVINFSGHSHYAMCDERSIHQDTYTSIQTQSTSYIELDSGYVNGSIPPKAEQFPACMIMDIDEQITIKRIDVNSASEIKPNNRWVLPLKPSRSNFTYNKTSSIDSPVLEGNIAIRTANQVAYLCFKAAHSSDMVHSYVVNFNGKKVHKYFSDFYCHGQQSDIVELPLYNIAKGTYDITVHAVDSFGNTSKSLSISGVKVIKRTKYRQNNEISMRIGDF